MTSPFDGLPDIFTSEFGQAVTLYPDQEAPVQVTAIFNPRSVDALGMSQPEAMLHMRAVDAAGVADGTYAQIGDQWFRVRVAEPDGKGMVPVRLESRPAPEWAD